LLILFVNETTLFKSFLCFFCFIVFQKKTKRKKEKGKTQPKQQTTAFLIVSLLVSF